MIDLTWGDLGLSRPELVRGYRQVEKHQDRQAREHLPVRRHTILGGGLVEERVYVKDRLVEVRRFTLGDATPTRRGQLARVGGRRLA